MNERIQELMSKAGTDTSGKWMSTFNAERFAELIVRECAKIAAQTPCPYEDDFAKQTYGHTWDMACIESSKEIKRYFEILK